MRTRKKQIEIGSYTIRSLLQQEQEEGTYHEPNPKGNSPDTLASFLMIASKNDKCYNTGSDETLLC